MDDERPLYWVGSSLADLREFPDQVKDTMGYALHLAQHGDKHPDAKPLKGFMGAGVLEVIDDFYGNTFRTVYTIKYRCAVYVLHAFQKKSITGINTAAQDIRLIKARLRRAEVHYRKHLDYL